MSETNEPFEMPNQNNQPQESSSDYTTRASEACAAGDMVLGMHLYLAAYEKAMADPLLPRSVAIASLREAWHLACDLKERSMAEYVFEKLEPYLSGDEASDCAEQLQKLALDRLEEFGFSRSELEDMAEMLSQDFFAGGSPILQVEHFALPHVPSRGRADEPAPESDIPAGPDGSDAGAAAAADGKPRIDLSKFVPDGMPPFVPEGQSPFPAQAKVPAFERPGEPAQDDGASSVRPGADEAQDGNSRAGDGVGFVSANDERLPGMPAPLSTGDGEPFNYRTLVGYDEAVAIMRDYGVGLADDRRFLNFVDMLNRRHGLDRMPALDSMLFRSVAREDAMRFVEATIGELGLPALRMSMEENFQGMPVLCVTTSSDNHPRMNQAHNRFEGPAVLVIEDLDLWTMPAMPENVEGWSGFVAANMSRGAREAINLIRSAVENPDVFVLVTASANEEVDPFFYEMLEPMSVIDIDFPTDAERADIWAEIVREHPSMRTINRVDLMRFSQGMPRYDIYMAAREAVEEAYKLGLVTRSYRAVTPQNIFEKLAAYQPLDSEEYRNLEAEVMKDFKRDLDHLEDLLDGSWE